MGISMGDKVTDEVSEFTGIVTAKVEYMTGCIQYLVTPKWVKGTAFAEGHWIDEIRLKSAHKKLASKKKEPEYPSRRAHKGRGSLGAGPTPLTRAGGKVGTSE